MCNIQFFFFFHFCVSESVSLTVASLQMLHFTTCWCVLPSTDMALWQTRQLITGALLLSGLPCGEYGGGGSPGTSELGNGAKAKEKKGGGNSLVTGKTNLYTELEKKGKYIFCKYCKLWLCFLWHCLNSFILLPIRHKTSVLPCLLPDITGNKHTGVFNCLCISGHSGYTNKESVLWQHNCWQNDWNRMFLYVLKTKWTPALL